MYLTETEGLALLRRVVDRFGTGELQFDAFNTFGIRTQWTNTVVRRSGATLRWAIDRPDDILDTVPGTRLLAWMSVFEDPVFDELAWHYRLLAKVMRPLSPLRYMAQYHRYAF